MEEQAANLPLDVIEGARILLRPVDTSSLEYIQLRDQLESGPLLCPISVRKHPKRPGFYEVIDGMHRFTIYKELGKTHIKVVIFDVKDDTEFLSLQIRANNSRIETKPVEFAKHLRRLMKNDPSLTEAELAIASGKSVDWVKKQLGLTSLLPDIQKLVDRGQIKVTNAYQLSKVWPPRCQTQFIQDAKRMTASEFRGIVTPFVNKVKVDARQGRLAEVFTGEFKPVPHLRRPGAILKELEDHTQATRVLTIEDAETPLDGWIQALKWVLMLDRASIEEKRKSATEKLKAHFIERTERDDEIENI